MTHKIGEFQTLQIAKNGLILINIFVVDNKLTVVQGNDIFDVDLDSYTIQSVTAESEEWFQFFRVI